MVSLFSGSIPPRLLLVMTLIVPLTSSFPIFSLNNFDVVSMSQTEQIWKVTTLPYLQSPSECFCMVLGFGVGFWRSRACMIDMAFIETARSGLLSVKASINRVNSLMKSLPAPPLRSGILRLEWLFLPHLDRLWFRLLCIFFDVAVRLWEYESLSTFYTWHFYTWLSVRTWWCNHYVLL